MQEREWYFYDEKKAEWGPGPWHDEPDKVQWTDPATGLPCLAVRQPHHGAWCGYVGVSQDHPFYEKSYDDVDANVAVHGGLTFSSRCMEDNREKGVCHIVEPGEPDDVWWLGFDCGHLLDLQPGYAALMKSEGLARSTGELPEVYRDLGYVQNECRALAAQLAGGSA